MKRSLLQRIGYNVEDLSFNEAKAKADFEWTYILKPLFFDDGEGGRIYSDQKAVVRSDRNEYVAAVPKTYEPLPPGKFLDTLYEVADAMKGKVVRLGHTVDKGETEKFLYGVVWVDSITLDREEGPDPVDIYFFITTGVCGGYRAYPVIERLISHSAYSASPLSEKIYTSTRIFSKYNWRGKWDSVIEKMIAAKTIIQDRLIWLAEQPLGEKRFKAILDEVLGDAKRSEKILDIFIQGGGCTRWEGLAAMMDYYNHYLTWKSFGSIFFHAVTPRPDFIKVANKLEAVR